ncbi:MAG TPA: hypothetical protein VG269_01495 [Tepidisphaeraceae bacterium]|jgi:hypothetical protein|nr:hypothetical protein [Tepidisphaeraceae bacterium]
MSAGEFILAGIALFIFFGTPRVVLTLIRAARILREKCWVSVRPRLQPTLAHQIPQPERDLLGHAARALKELNFTPAANGYCPDFGWNITWTHALFLNREQGDRASVMAIRQGEVANVTVAFATECPPDPQITTAAEFVIRKSETPFPDSLLPDLGDLHRKHQQALSHHAFASGDRLLPREGEEFAWLDDRAAGIAESIAVTDMGMARSDDIYRYTIWRAGRKVFPHVWPMRPFARMAKKLRGVKPQGIQASKGISAT